MKQAMSRVFRFAPSPNGKLHLGHAHSVLFNEKMAREAGGKLLLRIEDIDTLRCTEAHMTQMLGDLNWLGVAFEPEPLRQSQHLARYQQAISALQEMGLLYPCTCSRTEIVAKASGATDPEGQPLYPGTCRAKSHAPDQPVAWRIDMRRAVAKLDAISWREKSETVIADPLSWGDVVLGRKDIGVSYHIAVVVDDALQGVTDIVRGLDLYHATAIHRVLQKLLGLHEPNYHHHELIKTNEGEKLSKSKGHTSLADLRQRGVTVQEIRQSLGF